MDQITNVKALVLNSFLNFAKKAIDALPNFIGGIVLILVGWIISKIIAFIIKKSLNTIGFDGLMDKLKLTELLTTANIKATPTSIVSKFLYYIIFFFFLVPAFEVMGLQMVSEALTNFIAWLPNLMVALLTFILGYFIADLIRKVVKTAAGSFGAETGKLFGNVIFYFLLIIITITAINQAGMDTSIINSNITLAIGGVILAFAIAYGFASKDLLASIVSSFYNRKKYKIGQHIKIGELQGVIDEVDNVSVVLKTGTSKLVVPLSKLLTENVEILNEA